MLDGTELRVAPKFLPLGPKVNERFDIWADGQVEHDDGPVKKLAGYTITFDAA